MSRGAAPPRGRPRWFFFYGTLMDRHVLSTVLGRSVPPNALRAACLPGYRRVRRRGATYPVIFPDPAAIVDGVLIAGLRASDVAALVRYEGPDYRVAELDVHARGRRMVTAGVFLPGSGCEPTGEAWDIAAWRRSFGRAYLRRIRTTRAAPSREPCAKP